jgi:hypothetical protein
LGGWVALRQSDYAWVIDCGWGIRGEVNAAPVRVGFLGWGGGAGVGAGAGAGGGVEDLWVEVVCWWGLLGGSPGFLGAREFRIEELISWFRLEKISGLGLGWGWPEVSWGLCWAL